LPGEWTEAVPGFGFFDRFVACLGGGGEGPRWEARGDGWWGWSGADFVFEGSGDECSAGGGGGALFAEIERGCPE
jgi:hypothetical protein